MWLTNYFSRKVQFAISGSGRWNEREFRLDQLYCSPEVQRSQRNQPGTGGNSYCITVSGLEPGQMYDFQVSITHSCCRLLIKIFIATLFRLLHTPSMDGDMDRGATQKPQELEQDLCVF